MKSMAEKLIVLISQMADVENTDDLGKYIGEAIGALCARSDTIYIALKYHSWHRLPDFKPCPGCKNYFWNTEYKPASEKVEICFQCEKQDAYDPIPKELLG